MSARFLDAPARAAFSRAIETIESTSAVEVVIAVRRTSAGYHHANALVAALAVFAGLAAMLFSSEDFSILAILIDPFVVGAIAVGLVELAPAIKRGLTPRAAREREVRRAARATFVERGVHHTRDRSGLLVYISWLEQRAVVIADRGLDRALPAAALASLEDALTAAIPRGGAAVAAVLEADLGTLAPAVPRRADDRNELPDAIDSDLPGAGS